MQKTVGVLLNGAHVIDAWRLIPRGIVGMYGFLIYKLFVWYTGIPTHEEKSCDDALIKTLLENNVDITIATEMACTIVDTVGGPTPAQTSFVTVIVGLSSAMFAFYVNSGGSWRTDTNFNTSISGNKGKIPWRKPNDGERERRDERNEREEREERRP